MSVKYEQKIKNMRNHLIFLAHSLQEMYEVLCPDLSTKAYVA